MMRNDVAPLTESFSSIARSQIVAALGDSSDAALTADARVHAARTGIKRLRALFRLARGGFPDFTREDEFAREAARKLSRLRDAAVMKSTLQSLVEEDRASAKAAESISGRLDARLPSQEEQLAALGEFAAAAASILGRSRDWGIDRDLDALFADGAADTYRRARSAMRAAKSTGGSRHFHDWRKQAKYQFFQGEVLADRPGSKPNGSRRLAALTHLLGLHHDREVLRDFLATQPRHPQLERLDRAARASQQDLERQAFEIGAHIYRKAPHKWLAARDPR